MYAYILDDRLVITNKRVWKWFLRDGKKWYEFISCMIVEDDKEQILKGEDIEKYLKSHETTDLPYIRSKMGPKMRGYTVEEIHKYAYGYICYRYIISTISHCL